MRFTNIIASAALVVALGVSGAASAATLVGGVTVTDIDLPKVKEICLQLAQDASDAPSTTVTDSSSNTDTQKPMGSKTVDDITMQDCAEAGLIPADMMPADAMAPAAVAPAAN